MHAARPCCAPAGPRHVERLSTQLCRLGSMWCMVAYASHPCATIEGCGFVHMVAYAWSAPVRCEDRARQNDAGGRSGVWRGGRDNAWACDRRMTWLNDCLLSNGAGVQGGRGGGASNDRGVGRACMERMHGAHTCVLLEREGVCETPDRLCPFSSTAVPWRAYGGNTAGRGAGEGSGFGRAARLDADISKFMV